MNFKRILKETARDLFILADYALWCIADPSKFKAIRKNKIKKIIIIHDGAIGELLATTPLLKPLKREYNARIDYLVRNSENNILKGNPQIHKFLTWKKNWKENVSQLKKEQYDLAIILWPGSLNITTACLAAKIPYRIGCFKMVKEGPAFFYTRRWFPLRAKHQHAVQSNLDMIRLLGLDNEKPKMEIVLEKRDIEKIDNFLAKNKIKKFVIIHPGFGGASKSKSYSRTWPAETYASAAGLLIKKDYYVILTGIKEEKDFVQEIFKKIKAKKKARDSCGLFSLGELKALVKKASLVIAPDTSVVHIASAFDTSVIDLMGCPGWEWHPLMDEKLYRLINHPYVDDPDAIATKKTWEEKTRSVLSAINDLVKNSNKSKNQF